jgi:hypothetical protein
MSDDRRVGRRISAGEYLQIFKVGDPASTIVQVRLDRGSHWILSRQTFRLDRFPGLVGADPEADAATWNRFRFALQDEIDTTRHTLAKAVK